MADLSINSSKESTNCLVGLHKTTQTTKMTNFSHTRNKKTSQLQQSGQFYNLTVISVYFASFRFLKMMLKPALSETEDLNDSNSVQHRSRLCRQAVSVYTSSSRKM